MASIPTKSLPPHKLAIWLALSLPFWLILALVVFYV